MQGMSSPLQQVTILLTTFIWLRTTVSGCPPGWFGKNCIYKCHCRDVITCYVNGSCPDNGRCEIGFFGPSCQYVDLISTQRNSTVPEYLRDGDERTCNQDSHSRLITVTLAKPVHVIWFRVHFRQQIDTEFRIILNGRSHCDNRRDFYVSATILDVSCDSRNHLSKLQLEGNVIVNFCSLYISGGRNVALKQYTNQTTTFLGSTSDLAVDGDTDQDYQHGSCSHTSVYSTLATWSLYFKREHFIARVIIFNRDALQERLQGFTLQTSRKNGSRTFFFTDASPALLKYDITLPPYTRVSSMTITITSSVSGRALTLCEVETYGELLCQPQTYGIDCSNTCTCDWVETCNMITGACGPGCSRGRYGFNCSLHCNENCKYGNCDEICGQCERCNPGYKGPFCSEPCSDGTFGESCNMNCSHNCDDICDHVTGHCDCESPFTGSLCTECVLGTYGHDCSIPCPHLCDLKRCHYKTGVCQSCVGNRIGPFCEECPDNYHGPLCYTKCSRHCLNETCDPVNGSCSTCTNGFTGRQCRNAPDLDLVTEKWMWYILIIPCGLLTLCCLLLLGKRRSRPSVAEDEFSDIVSTAQTMTTSSVRSEPDTE